MIIVSLKVCRPELLRRFAFITGDILSPGTAQFLEETAVPCLSKPFRPGEAERIVARVLDGASI